MDHPSHLFACALREEEWSFAPVELREVRLEQGEAFCEWQEGWRISGSDALGTSPGKLRLEREAIGWLTSIPAVEKPFFRGLSSLRLVTQRRVIVAEAGSHRGETSLAIATLDDGSGSIICRPADLFERLHDRGAHDHPQGDRREELPILFRNGTASLLLHEAIGHAAEEGFSSRNFPDWLTVNDDPASLLSRDDTGREPERRDLCSSPPDALRRWSFRDVPLRRMTHVDVGCTQRVEAPSHRVEVMHVEEGALDIAVDRLTVSIPLAYEVDGGKRRRVSPFRLQLSRDALASRLAGATGEQRAALTVVCGAHGQRLPVSGEAPDILLRGSR